MSDDDSAFITPVSTLQTVDNNPLTLDLDTARQIIQILNDSKKEELKPGEQPLTGLGKKLNLLKKALKFAKINKQLRLTLVGSLSRGESNAKDIDFVASVPNLPNGKKYFKTKFEGVNVDIWQGNAITVFLRKLDKAHIIAIHKNLKKNDYSLSTDGFYNNKTGRKLIFTPKNVFDKAGLEFNKKKYFYL